MLRLHSINFNLKNITILSTSFPSLLVFFPKVACKSQCIFILVKQWKKIGVTRSFLINCSSRGLNINVSDRTFSGDCIGLTKLCSLCSGEQYFIAPTSYLFSGQVQSQFVFDLADKCFSACLIDLWLMRNARGWRRDRDQGGHNRKQWFPVPVPEYCVQYIA